MTLAAMTKRGNWIATANVALREAFNYRDEEMVRVVRTLEDHVHHYFNEMSQPRTNDDSRI